MITDCHVHITPHEMFHRDARALIERGRADLAQIAAFPQSPKAFLEYLDSAGVHRAVLINYVAREVIGLPPEVNEWVIRYCSADPERLLPCGGVDLTSPATLRAQMEQLLRLGIRLLKLHPPHQLFYPNAYRDSFRELENVYRIAEENGLPVMIHTGTSVFPGARNKYADPMCLDDVAIDFPRLKLLMAHGGRPIWMQTAFFLLRRHANLYLDISGIPPKSLLEYFPRLEQIAHKTLFGSDWPSPGVQSIAQNVQQLRELPLSEPAKQRILSGTALDIWPVHKS